MAVQEKPNAAFGRNTSESALVRLIRTLAFCQCQKGTQWLHMQRHILMDPAALSSISLQSSRGVVPHVVQRAWRTMQLPHRKRKHGSLLLPHSEHAHRSGEDTNRAWPAAQNERTIASHEGKSAAGEGICLAVPSARMLHPNAVRHRAQALEEPTSVCSNTRLPAEGGTDDQCHGYRPGYPRHLPGHPRHLPGHPRHLPGHRDSKEYHCGSSPQMDCNHLVVSPERNHHFSSLCTL
jgi:hypothetical protein